MPNREDPMKAWEFGSVEDTALPPHLHTSTPPHQPTAIRLGLRLVAGLGEEDIKTIEAAREERPFESLLDFCIRVPLSRDKVENLILCGAFDSLHEHRRGLLWRLDETMALAVTYRGGEGEIGRGGENAKCKVQNANCKLNSLDHHPSRITHHASVSPSPPLPLSLSLNLGSVRSIATPIAWDIDDFSPWDKFMWTWRLTGVTAEAHVFAWMREKLKRKGVMTAYDAQRQKPGTRVTVAGLNIRPHRPRTVSGNPVLFTIVEDETEMLQTSVFGDAIWETTTVFLTSPAVIVRGKIERRGNGSSLMLEKAMPLRFQDFAEDDGEPIAVPPAQRTYTGTKIHAHNPATPAPLAPV